MSLLNGMNGMLDNELALESALEMVDDELMMALEADEVIDAMVDGIDEDDDILDDLDDLEEEALEASIDLEIQMDKTAANYMKDGMSESDAYHAAYEAMVTCAESFYGDPDTCDKVKTMLSKIAGQYIATESDTLTGTEFLKSLVFADEDYDANTGSVGVGGAADFEGNASIWDPDDDPNTASSGSIGNAGGGVPDHKDNASVTDHTALESLVNEMEADDQDDDYDLDDALDSML